MTIKFFRFLRKISAHNFETLCSICKARKSSILSYWAQMCHFFFFFLDCKIDALCPHARYLIYFYLNTVTILTENVFCGTVNLKITTDYLFWSFQVIYFRGAFAIRILRGP